METCRVAVSYTFLLEHEAGCEEMVIDLTDGSPKVTENERVSAAVRFLRQHRPFHTYRILNITAVRK